MKISDIISACMTSPTEKNEYFRTNYEYIRTILIIVPAIQ